MILIRQMHSYSYDLCWAKVSTVVSRNTYFQVNLPLVTASGTFTFFAGNG
ncbi:hypothetical protein NIES4074_00180 [Cylindrospermum sp. NIES-4074]|nr:hypothetical protein NIES4074_00180 [Cylindrospermum sp. NIES-4074]